MRAILLFLLCVIPICSAGEPLIPTLFKTYITDGRLEQKLGDCKKMPARDIEEIHGWLKGGTWKKDQKALPKIPSAGSFLFRETGTKRAWVITLLAGSEHLIVQEAAVGPGGIPTVDTNSLECLEHPRFAKALEAEVRRSFPEGAQRIDEELELRRSR